jgi:hypothetical protein
MNEFILGAIRATVAMALLLFTVCTCASATPCIDTNSESSFFVGRTMSIERLNSPELRVNGSIVSIDPVTKEVGFRVFGIDEEQRLKPTLIRFSVAHPNMAAQMAQPIATPLGPFAAEIALTEITVSDGIVRFAGCSMPLPEHESGFVGTMTINNSTLKINGTFFDYSLPKNIDSTGAQKRG